jgi:hypothetical protein
MKRVMFLVAVLSMGFISFANAQGTVLEKVALGAAYIPVGFDNINRSQLVVEGVFRDTCFRVGPHQIQVNGGTITITQGTYRYKGFCSDMLVPFSQTIELGILKIGSYTVVDGVSGRVLGTLPIVQAPVKSAATYPDDYLYAPISDASLLVEGGQKRIVLSGTFTDDCTRLTEIRTQIFGKVIQVLPITERSPGACHRKFHPFQISKPVVVPDGHYLLHVRSLSGNAVSKMVDAYDF